MVIVVALVVLKIEVFPKKIGANVLFAHYKVKYSSLFNKPRYISNKQDTNILWPLKSFLHLLLLWNLFPGLLDSYDGLVF